MSFIANAFIGSAGSIHLVVMFARRPVIANLDDHTVGPHWRSVCPCPPEKLNIKLELLMHCRYSMLTELEALPPVSFVPRRARQNPGVMRSGIVSTLGS